MVVDREVAMDVLLGIETVIINQVTEKIEDLIDNGFQLRSLNVLNRDEVIERGIKDSDLFSWNMQGWKDEFIISIFE